MKEFFHYNRILILQDFSIDNFLTALVGGQRLRRSKLRRFARSDEILRRRLASPAAAAEPPSYCAPMIRE